MKQNNQSSFSAWVGRFGIGREKNYVIENLSTLIASGVGVNDALDSIHSELHSLYLKKIIKVMINQINNGLPLWRALNNTGLFSESVISLIQIGEQSGQLTKNLKVVAQRNKKNRNFKSKLQSAMMYPLFVLGLTLVVGVGIAWFILPKLSTVFDQLNVELPLLTQIVIDLGIFLENHGAIAVPIFFVVIVTILLVLFVFPKTKHLGQNILLHIPGIGRLIKEVELTRFSYLFGILLSAGIPVIEALSSLESSTSIRRYKKFYTYLKEKIEEGQSLKKSFKGYSGIRKIIPAPLQQMVVTGEQSGSLSNVLIEISEMYEEKLEATTKNVSVLLEPILLVIVWLGVVGIALAVILPIYGLLSGVR